MIARLCGGGMHGLRAVRALALGELCERGLFIWLACVWLHGAHTCVPFVSVHACAGVLVIVLMHVIVCVWMHGCEGV